MIQQDRPQEDLLAWLEERYDLTGMVSCHLLRSYTNDVYAVRTQSSRFILKIYGSRWRTEADIRYEVALLQHLCARGLPIPAPIAGRKEFINQFNHAGEVRHALLFEYAEGEKPQPPFTPELYFAFGRAIARMHELSTDFETETPRASLDLSHLLDASVAQILPLCGEQADRAFLADLAAEIKGRMLTFVSQGLEWGPIHGDATLDNVHVKADGDVILYDFDSGGPGWRAADLQGWAMNSETHRQQWEAFYAGYSSVRRLDPVNLLAAPYLTLVWDIWGMKIDLDNRISPQNLERIQSYLAGQIAQLRERYKEG